MRKYLLLALLLYDVVTSGTRPNNYDYDDIIGNKRQTFDDRRNWRKKALQKSIDSDHREWDDRRRYENYNPRYADNIEQKGFTGTDRQREIDPTSSIYKNERRYDDFSKMKYPPNVRSSEIEHSIPYLDKEEPKKPSIQMNCQRQHERRHCLNWIKLKWDHTGRTSFQLKKGHRNPFTQSKVLRFEACFAGCAAVTCDNPRERLRPCYPFCEPGCVCVQPYVRDDRTHKCVLPEDCTKGLKGIPDLAEDI